MSIEKRDGFTLLEIMVVVLIIGMLMTLLATNVFRRTDDARKTIAGAQIQKLSQQLELYKLDNGTYPTGEQGLEALVREPTGEPRPKHYPAGGYVTEKDLYDPWKNAFKYERPGANNPHSFDLYSYGPDGVAGGEADITNWEVAQTDR